MDRLSDGSHWNVFQLLLAVILPAIATTARAEYRAYELIVTNQKLRSSYTLVSTLDPQQYLGYYSIEPGETLRMGRTWMCWGNTANFKRICPPSSFAPPAATVPAKQ